MENYKIFTSNKLKIYAIIAMFFDHLALVFEFKDTTAGMILRTIGRTVAPIMCYFIAEGYYYTSDRKKYILRLLIFAAISHLPYVISLNMNYFKFTSVMWSLALGLIALTAVKADKLHILLKLLILGACCIFAIPANWNFVVVLWIVAFGLFRGNLKLQIISFCAIGLIFYLADPYSILSSVIKSGQPEFTFLHWNSFWYKLGIFLTIPFLTMYNGQRGKKSKVLTWSFYVFYPVHLIVLFLLYKIPALANLTQYLR